jgi:hypothetical protein
MNVRLVLKLALVLLPASAGLVACGSAGRATPGVASALPAAGHAAVSQQLVGYWDGWSQNNLSSTPGSVGEIPIAFGFLRGHTITLKGGVNPGFVTAADIASLHARGIKVSLSLGGSSPTNSFVFDGDVKGFEASLSSVLAKLPFDGVDFDLEHGSTAQRVKTLTTLIVTTRAYFNARGMADAVVTYPAWNLPGGYGDAAILKNPSVAAALSWVNVMSYEHDHVAATERDVAAYGAIFDRSKLRMGIDIDDAPIPTEGSLHQLSAWVYANGYGGFMAWTVNNITADQLAALGFNPGS